MSRRPPVRVTPSYGRGLLRTLVVAVVGSVAAAIAVGLGLILPTSPGDPLRQWNGNAVVLVLASCLGTALIVTLPLFWLLIGLHKLMRTGLRARLIGAAMGIAFGLLGFTALCAIVFGAAPWQFGAIRHLLLCSGACGLVGVLLARWVVAGFQPLVSTPRR